MKSTLIRLIVVAAVAAVAATGYYVIKRLPERKREIPTVQVKRGDLVVRTFVRGELRAVRSMLLTAPNLGSATQVSHLAPAGALAKAKDLIVEFDDSELIAALEDAELEVAQVGENIKKAEADLKIRRSQDQVELLRARYAVRRAELEVKRNELVSKIDARKNELTLEEARRALAKLEEDVKSRLAQGEAEIAVLREQQRKAQIEVNRVKTRLAQTKILTPMTGLVAVKENRSGGFFFGQQAPDIREGDQVSPGTPVAEILDLSELEVATRVNEIERASLREGQEVLVRLDALPGKVVRGKIKALSGTASSNVFSSDPTKKFDCTLSIDMREMLAHVGASPQQIERILATAAENAKRFGSSAMTPSASAGITEESPRRIRGGEPGGPGAEGAPSGEGGRAASQQRSFRGGGGGASDADRQRMREAFQKALGGRNPQDLSAEERQKIFAELREKMGGATLGGAGGSEGGPGLRGGPDRSGTGGPGGGPGGEQGFGGQGRAARRAGPGELPDLASLSLRQAAGQQFSEADRQNAQLPAPPEENSEIDVMLRPGLLVEAEIIVEKIPDTLYLPQQAVFEKDGRTVVFVRSGDDFQQRVVKLGKRTESQVAILEGLREGDHVSLTDVQAAPQPTKKGKTPERKQQQPAMPKAPGGFPGGRS